MALMTRSSKQEERHYVLHRSYGTLGSGQHIRLTGTPPDWLARSGSETDAPYPADPEAIFAVDTIQEAADARMIAEAAAAAVRPDVELTTEQLQRKIPALRDPQNYELARTQLNFPAPRKKTAGWGLRELGDVWSESAVDRWLADMRAKLEQLARFV